MATLYTPQDIADWFLGNIDREAGDSITPLKLQKLVYYAQAWSLASLNRPLFSEEIEAWAHGPVVESLFHKYRECGWNAIGAPENIPNLDDETEELLSEVLDVYGEFSAKHLERLTHGEAPWLDARGGLSPEARSNTVISKASMKTFYARLVDDQEDDQE